MTRCRESGDQEQKKSLREWDTRRIEHRRCSSVTFTNLIATSCHQKSKSDSSIIRLAADLHRAYYHPLWPQFLSSPSQTSVHTHLQTTINMRVATFLTTLFAAFACGEAFVAPSRSTSCVGRSVAGALPKSSSLRECLYSV